MRYPTTHSFLKWAGPTAVVFAGACLALVAAFAQTYDGVKNWAQKLFDQWWPIVSAGWFLLCGVIVICAYIWVLAYTGGQPRPRPRPPVLSHHQLWSKLFKEQPEHPIVAASQSNDTDPVDLAYRQEAARQRAKRDAERQRQRHSGKWARGLIGSSFETLEERAEQERAERMERDRQAIITKAETERAKLISLQQQRREMIVQGRNIVYGYRHAGMPESWGVFTERQRFYLDIRPHLGDEYWKGVINRVEVADAPRKRDYECAMFERELARLEKEWGLI